MRQLTSTSHIRPFRFTLPSTDDLKPGGGGGASETSTCAASGDAGAATMIDLSFLTEEEQEIIQEVLRRDAELKKAEEQRIQ